MPSLARRRSARRRFALRRPRLALACALACLAAASVGARLSAAAGCSAPSFRPRPVYRLGDDARAIAAADFNADGKLDLVGVSYGVGQITVFLNAGGGTHAAGTNYAVGRNPIAAAAADFNGDGKPDLAVADDSTSGLALLLNDGAGGFRPATFLNAGGFGGRWLAAGDFNRDGRADLAAASSSNLSVLLGNGAGGFNVAATHAVGATHVVVSDFNNDAKQDLAVAPGFDGPVQIFLGDGAGAFARQANNCAAIAGTTVAAGDINNDGRADLVAGSPLSDAFSVALGDGAGCFGATTSHSTVNDRPRSIHLADFNGDGKLDALTNGTLSLGDGAGKFGPPTQFGPPGQFAPPGHWAVVPGDFDGDTKLDVGVVRSGPTGGQPAAHGLTVYFGDGAGGFRFTTGNSPNDIAAGDFNEDGKADIVTADAGSARLSLFLGDGAGGYAPPVIIPLANSTPARVRAVDLNADANLDLVVLRSSPRSVAVLLGNGAGGFVAPASYALTIFDPLVFDLADFNAGGWADVVALDQGSGLNVLLGAAGGTFGPATAIHPNVPIARGLAVADFNGDGRPDLALSSSFGNVAILLGNGAGGFGQPVSYPTGGPSPAALVAGDFNADGRADVVAANAVSANVVVLLGDGAGALGQPANFATGPEPGALVAADFNGDGQLDAATASSSTVTFNNVSVLLGDGAGRLAAPSHYATEATPRNIIAADLSADGLPDLATANNFGNSFSVLLNSCSGASSAASVQFDAPSYTVNESSPTAVITVRRTGDASGEASVEYATVDDSAAVRCDDVQTAPGVAFARCDYATAVGTVRFAPGETLKTLPISIIDDAHPEFDEIIRLALRAPTGAALGAQNTATLTITSNDPAGSQQNPIDGHPFFVRQQYLDFLSREPEPAGLAAWLSVLNGCANAFNHDRSAPSAGCDRNLVSSAFFRSEEFQLKGGQVFRFYRAAFGRLPLYTEIVADMSRVTGQTPAEVFSKKAAFAEEFAARPEFLSAHGAETDAQYVAALMGRYGLQSITTPDPAAPDGGARVTLTRQQLVERLAAGSLTRGRVLRAVADSDEVGAAEFDRAFVAMQYFGYLRRDPDAAGFQAWLDYLATHPGDFYTMVDGFLYSQEYRLRFGPVN